MNTWFSSRNTAIRLSVIALLTELWRAWPDMLFECPGGSAQAEAAA